MGIRRHAPTENPHFARRRGEKVASSAAEENTF